LYGAYRQCSNFALQCCSWVMNCRADYSLP
jgi:hypothetical protein